MLGWVWLPFITEEYLTCNSSCSKLLITMQYFLFKVFHIEERILILVMFAPLHIISYDIFRRLIIVNHKLLFCHVFRPIDKPNLLNSFFASTLKWQINNNRFCSTETETKFRKSPFFVLWVSIIKRRTHQGFFSTNFVNDVLELRLI